MNILKSFFVCFSFLFSFNLHSQDFYFIYGNEIFEFDSNTCDTNFVVTPDTEIHAITFDFSGNLYGSNSDSGDIFLIDQNTGETSFISNIGQNLNGGEIVADQNGKIYFIGGNTLISVDVDSGIIQYYPNFSFYVFGATYVNGHIYFVTPTEGIFELNPEEPVNSTLIYPITFSWEEILLPAALASYPVTCDSSALYINYTNEINENTFQVIDLETQTSEEVCYFELNIGSITSPAEYTEWDCLITLDLDSDNSTGASGFDFMGDTTCQTSGLAVADNDVSIFSEAGGVDSIEVFVTSDLINIPEQYINVVPQTGIGVLGNYSADVTLINEGEALLTDFENAIQQITYNNDHEPFTGGNYELGFVVWFNGQGSDTTYASFPIFNLTPQAGEDSEITICMGDQEFQLFDLLGNTTETGGEWIPQTNSQDGLFNPDSDEAGIYQYIQVGENGCPSDTAAVLVEISEATDFTLGDDVFLCNGESILLMPDVTGNSYFWQDGSSESSFEATESGIYWLELENEYGCYSTDTLQVTIQSVVQTSETINICEGENYMIDGIPFFTDTTLCVTYSGSNGCDSIVCTQLNLWPSPEVNLGPDQKVTSGEEVILSVGSFESYLWSDGSFLPQLVVLESGEFTVTVTDENGCSASDEVVVNFSQSRMCYIPNVFSPNGDGINDIFTFYAEPGALEIMDLKVFDRWGELVFLKQDFAPGDIHLGWDGTFKGQPMQSDVFIYVGEVKWFDGTIEQLFGEVTLLK